MRQVSRREIKKAAAVIKKGGLVVFPTETVYGIAADPLNKKAVRRLNGVKKRPRGKPYTLHIAHKKDIFLYVRSIPAPARDIIKEKWPGPFTLILKDKNGRKKGFRMPDNKIARAFIRAVGRPVAATSANVSGRPSPVKADDVHIEADMVLDGGPARLGRDSAVIDFTGRIPYIRRGMGARNSMPAL